MGTTNIIIFTFEYKGSVCLLWCYLLKGTHIYIQTENRRWNNFDFRLVAINTNSKSAICRLIGSENSLIRKICFVFYYLFLRGHTFSMRLYHITSWISSIPLPLPVIGWHRSPYLHYRISFIDTVFHPITQMNLFNIISWVASTNEERQSRIERIKERKKERTKKQTCFNAEIELMLYLILIKSFNLSFLWIECSTMVYITD